MPDDKPMVIRCRIPKSLKPYAHRIIQGLGLYTFAPDEIERPVRVGEETVYARFYFKGSSAALYLDMKSAYDLSNASMIEHCLLAVRKNMGGNGT